MVIDDIAFTFIVFNNVIYCACKNSTFNFFHNKSAEEEKRRSFLEYNLLLTKR